MNCSIGFELDGGRIMFFVRKGDPLPIKKEYNFITPNDNQTTLEINLFRGESEFAPMNEFIETIRITNIPEAPVGTYFIVATFEISAQGVMTITAVASKTSGEKVDLTIETTH